jgi:hypothetical protein
MEFLLVFMIFVWIFPWFSSFPNWVFEPSGHPLRGLGRRPGSLRGAPEQRLGAAGEARGKHLRGSWLESF